MSTLTVKAVNNLKPGSTISEPIKGKGSGALVFRNRNGVIESYYRYYKNETRIMLKLGLYKHGNNSGYSLAETRQKALEYAQLKLLHPDLKEYLEYQEQQKQFQQKIQDSSGNFKKMLDSYAKSLSNERTRNNVINLFKHDIWEPFPELKQKKPADVDESDIVIILKKVFDRGVTTNGNRLRSYLSAAFNHAIKTTNDPLKQDKFFNVQRNPIINIPKQRQFERTVERNLSPEEVKHFLTHIVQTKGVTEIVAKAIKFLFYIAGQRPLQVLREGWASYDYRRKTLLIIDTKGRGSQREYLTPLTDRALEILDSLPTQHMPYPFTTDGINPVRVETLLKSINKYCKEYEVERFTLRDLRRSCKNLMIDAGVNRETRNLIQNHGLTGIDFKHYDKHDHMPEKTEGMAKYDRFLDRLLNEKPENIVHLKKA